MKSLESRITSLEGNAGIGLNLPDVIIVSFMGDDEPQRASFEGENGQMQIDRRRGESLDDFEQRAKALIKRPAAGCVPLLYLLPADAVTKN